MMGLSRQMVAVVIGSTGTGKSKLAIELAKRFNGEIISVDSMQVYSGLDLLTNKVTKREMAEVPHHMIGFLQPDVRFHMNEYVRLALPIVNDVLQKGKLPIICGGTYYYIESLLWDNSIETESQSESCSDDSAERDGSPSLGDHARDHGPETGLWETLHKVDPLRADRIHPHDKRKILRSLAVFERTGVQHSELLSEQHRKSGSSIRGPLRFVNSVVFHLDADKSVKHRRVYERADQMISNGLVRELSDFYSQHIANNSSASFEEGMLQSIGLKDFESYLTGPRTDEKLRECVELLKISTRQYIRRQDKWFRNRLLRVDESDTPLIYELDVTDPSLWTSHVFTPACSVIDDLLAGREPSVELAHRLPSIQQDRNSRNFCQICDHLIMGDAAYNAHLGSRRHSKLLARSKKSVINDLELNGTCLSVSCL